MVGPLSEGTGVPVIELLGVSKDYESEGGVVRALRETSLSIELGEFVALVGTSGSGKSTMMNILGCLDRPTRGIYRIVGFDAGSRAADSRAMIRNRLIGFIFQGFNLLSRTTALENVELPLQYRGVPRKERRQRAMAALEAVGLGGRVKHRPNELSGGQQQRVAIARALVTNPPIILADEPTGALDTRTSLEVLSFLQRLNRERRITIVLVTHEPDIAACATRIITMRDGRIVSDTPNEPTNAEALLRALPPAAAPGAFGSTAILDGGQPKPLPKVPRSAYAAMAAGGLAGLVAGLAYNNVVLGQPELWPILLFALVGECIAGERAVRRQLAPLRPAQAARVAVPYTILAAALIGGLFVLQESWWPAPLVARASSLGAGGIIGVVFVAILGIAVLGLARTLLISVLSPSR